MTNFFGKIVSKVNAKEEIKKRLSLKKCFEGNKINFESNGSYLQNKLIFKKKGFLN